MLMSKVFVNTGTNVWHFLHCLDTTIDVFVLTAVNIDGVSAGQFTSHGFHNYFRTRPKSRGGGIPVFVIITLVVTQTDTAFFILNVLRRTRLTVVLESLLWHYTARLQQIYRHPSWNL